jgi:hypothetical protein
MIFMSTTSTTICRGALQRKSNVAVTFTDAQSDSSFVVVHHMLGRANITGQEPRAHSAPTPFLYETVVLSPRAERNQRSSKCRPLPPNSKTGRMADHFLGI